MWWFILLLLVAAVAVLLGTASLRLRYVSAPIFQFFKRILPPLSATEQEAMAAGTVWWEGELFRGRPDWKKLLDYPPPALSAEEQAFLEDKVGRLLQLVDAAQDWEGTRDLPSEAWRFMREEGFFALIIPKEYGGRGFSSYANSCIVGRIASRSLNAAVTVMVPNSLGPAELLLHYGTHEQKRYWLPRLASGEEIPCFALTALEAGSDAGAIRDQGVVCRGEWQGETVLGIRLDWDKRYITLAPQATVLGLAFKLYDPDHLLGERTEYGITCALIPTSLPGVQVGERHRPMGPLFLNGPTRGQGVFIPLDGIIGGPDYAGKGWRMLVECLSAGRGISLPALGTACGQLATRTTSAYALVRQQFGLPIGRFEGVQEALARIAGLTYQQEAARRLTLTGLGLGERPGVVTAIAKYHMTEMARQVISDAMDVHGGRGVQLGPKNYLANHYMGLPIAITVEGANILTRSLMIFGQGATRCHPFVSRELEAAANPDGEAGLRQFDQLLLQHLRYSGINLLSTFASGLTWGWLEKSPVPGDCARYYRQLSRMSRALALMTDAAMLMLGGGLKRRELLSARLGDVLSQLYLASASLKLFEDQGRRAEELPLLRYGLDHALHQMGMALVACCHNFPNPVAGHLLRFILFPFGMGYRPPADDTIRAVCEAVMQPGDLRERLTHLCYLQRSRTDAVGLVELAFEAVSKTQGLLKRLHEAQKGGTLPAGLAGMELVEQARQQGVLTTVEAEQLQEAEALRHAALMVDSFAPGELG